MKRASIATAAVALGLVASSGAAVAGKPSLTLLRLTPAKLHGSHFRAGERVGITFSAGRARILRTVRVSRKGEFTVVLGAVTRAERCGGDASLVAVGALGDRTTVKLPRTGCAAAVTPTSPTTTTVSGDQLQPPPPYTT
ncbi:MAG TPA: hypothetical protein VH063_09555 [Gaiellaceae bacterium]|jgi:hypothetical protein|nr:hypothetical protein [Gaiellaceae bacterium]